MSMSTMRIRAGLAAIFLGLVLAACGASTDSLSTDAAPTAQALVDEEANATGPGLPDFIGNTVAGSQINTNELDGQNVVVWFWAPWCVRCRVEAPAVAAVQAELGEEVVFLGLPSRSDDVDSMVAFVEDTGVEGFEHLIDLNSAVWTELGVTDQPAFAFIDENGVVDVMIGALGEEALAARVQELLDS